MRDVKAAEDKKRFLQREAAGKAAWILKQCQYGHHQYLKAKGYEDEQVNVWAKDGIKTMVIPMRVDGHLVGVQLIDEAGTKKFLFGQRTSGASFVFDNRGVNVLCEGYATALAIRKALKNMKRRYTLHVCFSAGNMVKVAASLGSGFVVADNDASGTGERVAKEIGWPTWMSDTVGEDADDCLKRRGLFKFSQSLVKSMDVG
jgi:putative DNA primase/helicase